MPAVDTVDATSTVNYSGVVAIIPALNEADSLPGVLAHLVRVGNPRVIVCDNGSTDGTDTIARAAGATVVYESERGYGAACLAALAALPSDASTVVFCDADGADDLDRFPAVVDPVVHGGVDLMIGSRVLGGAERGALSWPQRTGNLFAAALMRLLYRVQVTDLGPFRCINRQQLDRIAMQDRAFGWTTEMQVKAYRLGLRVAETPVQAKVRTAGVSKISGTLRGVWGAGWAIISTVLKNARWVPTDTATAQPTTAPSGQAP